MKNLQTFDEFLNEAIEIISMTDAGTSNRGKGDTTLKHNEIIDVLSDPETWTDDISFKDKSGNVYFIDDLIDKEVKVGSKKLTIIEESEDILNEDVTSILPSLMLLMQSTALLAVAMAKSNQYSGDDISIKDWWNEWKKDRKVNKILDKLKDDPEIVQFLNLPNYQQKGKWQKLIKTKLKDDELDLLTSISRDRVKRGKI
jgi:hypothetical protein